MMLKLVSNNQFDSSEQKAVRHRERRFQLAKLLRCTEEILIHAQRSDWEAVEVMENQRHAEIAACFENTDIEETPLIAEALGTLIYMNEQITQLVVIAKNEALAESQALRSGTRAVRQYQDFQDEREGLESRVGQS